MKASLAIVLNALCLVLLFQSSALCSFTLSGQIIEIVPPSDLSQSQSENAMAQFFVEQTMHMLGSDLLVNHDGSPGMYLLGGLSPVGAVVPAGTVVNSYYLHMDPPDATPTSVSGSITFLGEILGIIFRDQRLDLSDAELGHPSVMTYHDARMLEEDTEDSFTVSSDRKTFSLSFLTDTGVDDVRIVTETVPEPASIAVWSMIAAAALLGAVWCRRDVDPIR